MGVLRQRCVRENFSEQGRWSERAAGGYQGKSFLKTLMMQGAEDAVGNKTSGPIEYRAASGHLAKRGIGK